MKPILTGPAMPEPPSGSMTAWDLADALVQILRERPQLVIVEEFDGDYVNIQDNAVRLFEVRIQEVLRLGGIRP